MNFIVVCCLMIVAQSVAVTFEDVHNSIRSEDNLLKSINQDVKIEEPQLNRNFPKVTSKEKDLKPIRVELDFKCDISPNKRLECMEKCKQEGYSGSTCRLFKNCRCFRRRRTDCKKIEGCLKNKNN